MMREHYRIMSLKGLIARRARLINADSHAIPSKCRRRFFRRPKDQISERLGVFNSPLRGRRSETPGLSPWRYGRATKSRPAPSCEWARVRRHDHDAVPGSPLWTRAAKVKRAWGPSPITGCDPKRLAFDVRRRISSERDNSRRRPGARSSPMDRQDWTNNTYTASLPNQEDVEIGTRRVGARKWEPACTLRCVG